MLRKLIQFLQQTILGKEAQDPNSLHSLKQFQQQRENFRVYLSPDSGVQLFITLHAKLPCTINNLSNSGIAFTAPGDVSQQISTGETLEACELQLPGQTLLTVNIVLKTISLTTENSHQTAISGKMIIQNKEQTKALNQFIWALQRKQRQQEVGQQE